jgi:hypothetical protein
MTQMKVSVPLRHKDAKRFAEESVGVVTEHGLDTVACEINVAGLVNDDYGIGIFLQKAVELILAHFLSLACGVTEPTSPVSTPGVEVSEVKLVVVDFSGSLSIKTQFPMG